MGAKIQGGYYIKAKRIQESAITSCAPCVREVWDLLLRKANWKDAKWNGIVIKRGQLVITHQDLQNHLHWMVGFRKMVYSEDSMKKAMKMLRSLSMIAQTKALNYTITTICNYEFYQDINNYVSTDESTDESTLVDTTVSESTPIKKEDKDFKDKKEEDINIPSKPKKEVQAKLIDIPEKKHPLQKWIEDEKLENVLKLKKQLSYQDCEKLIEEYGNKSDSNALMKKTLHAMENCKPLTQKYISVNLVLRDWIERDLQKNNGQNTNQEPFRRKPTQA